MTDTDTLRPEVQKALDDLSYFLTGTHNHNDFYIIRAELLRLAQDCAEHAAWRDINERARFDQQQRAERAEAELAALRASERYCLVPYLPNRTYTDVDGKIYGYAEFVAPQKWFGHEVRLRLVREDGDA